MRVFLPHLGKECRRNKPWVTRDAFNLCDERRELKERRYEEEEVRESRKANKVVQNALKKAREYWIYTQCNVIDACLNKNKSYQLKKNVVSEKQGKFRTIQDKFWKCLTKEQEYCSDLYNFESYSDNTVLDCSYHPGEDLQPILREKVEIAVVALNRGKSARSNNIPAEHVQDGGETMIDFLT